MLKLLPFPTLTTERLLLRQLSKEDVQTIFLLRSDEIINKFIKRTRLENIEEAYTFINKMNKGFDKGTVIDWAITLKKNNVMIGRVCLWNFSEDRTVAELGYEMNTFYEGNGFMNEAINCVIDYAFNTIAVTKIEAYTNRDNERSVRLLRRIGFVLNSGKVDVNNVANIVYSSDKK